MKIFFLSLLNLCFTVNALSAYQYEIAVAAIFRNEARFLPEWIEYYKLQGVEHFYLYNNCSDDNFSKVLAPYIMSGEVELFNWSFIPRTWKSWDNIQKAAYKHALKRAKKKAKWLAIVDIDEFIVPIVEDIELPLQNFLAPYSKDKKLGGLCLAWVFFGTSNIAKLETDQLMIEQLILNGGAACGGDYTAIWNSGSYKSIVRPKYVKEVQSPHYCSYKNGRGHILIEFDKAQLNHYWTRDEEFLYRTKIPRRCEWGQSTDEILKWASGMNTATHYGEPILKFVPALIKRMGNKPTFDKPFQKR